jgi:hypothetical protein
VPEGTYRIEVRTYSDKNGKISAISRSEVCTVPNTGTVTCNVVLRDPNFIGLIATPTGENFSYANAYLQRQVGTNLIWDQSPSIYDNKFYAYLENGTYRAVVFPYSSYRSLYTERQYEIVVNSGTITSVKNLTTGETLTAAAGIFTLKLGTPSVTGTVRLPGTSTVGAENVQVIVTSVTGGGKKGWRTSTTSDSQGKFAMTLPDGIYGIQAIPMGGGFTYGKSVYETFTVTGGNIAAPLLLRLRNPNLTGQVITPGQNGVALANVNVAIYVDGEYFNGWTDTDGRFGVYVDNPTPNCPSRCSLTLSYYKSSEYTPKSYSISSIGNLGTKAIGGVNTRVSVLVPQAGNTTVANGFGSVSLQKIDSVTGAASWVTSIQTDALGQASLTLEEGFHYKIWAYPNSTYSSAFSVKVVDIPSFTVADDGAQTITFDRPNINFAVTTRTNGLPNARGWFEIRKDDGSGNYDLYLNNYLDGQGKGAALLSNGSYKITFWPGKVVASQITVDVSVSNGTASGGEITSGLATVLLPGGNISGYISNDSGTVIAGALVAAIPNGDASQAIMTKTDETGYYELTLNRSYAWEVKAMDPISTNVNSRTIAINALNSQAALSNQNIIVANAP